MNLQAVSTGAAIVRVEFYGRVSSLPDTQDKGNGRKCWFESSHVYILYMNPDNNDWYSTQT